MTNMKYLKLEAASKLFYDKKGLKLKSSFVHPFTCFSLTFFVSKEVGNAIIKFVTDDYEIWNFYYNYVSIS